MPAALARASVASLRPASNVRTSMPFSTSRDTHRAAHHARCDHCGATGCIACLLNYSARPLGAQPRDLIGGIAGVAQHPRRAGRRRARARRDLGRAVEVERARHGECRAVGERHQRADSRASARRPPPRRPCHQRRTSRRPSRGSAATRRGRAWRRSRRGSRPAPRRSLRAPPSWRSADRRRRCSGSIALQEARSCRASLCSAIRNQRPSRQR